jgi:hypothetical protein
MSESALGFGRCKEQWAMKLFTRWMLSAGLVFTAAAANAQMLERYGIDRGPYVDSSDMGGPMEAMPPEAPRYGLSLLPPAEVDSIARESGFSPLGIPHLRGVVYTVSVLDRVGDDGRLVIDGRSGRIISFVPADRMGDRMNEGLMEPYGPSGPPRPAVGVPRPPASVPHVLASRTPPPMPLPMSPPRPGDPKPLAAKPAPTVRAQASTVTQPRSAPADAQAAMPAPAETKPGAAVIRPTQPMPAVQGLD